MTINSTAVIGIGNILMGDDGVGIMVLREIEKIKDEFNKGQNLSLIDGGTDFFLIIHTLMSYNYTIIIDALSLGNTPGSIYSVSFDKVLKWNISQGFSFHDTNPVSMLKYIHSTDCTPKGCILGIEPQNIALKVGLSPAVKKSIPKIIRIAIETINSTL